MFVQSCSLVSSIPAKRPNFSLARFILYSTCALSVEKFMTHLQKNGCNIEKSLSTVKAKLDTSCISGVLEKCSIDKSQMGLRFFIWAGIQPSYRHSSYMYSKAYKLLEIDRNPRIINDVIDAYRVENYGVSVKMFKVVLNLCREANDANLGLWVLKKMKEFNCRPDTTMYNVVIRLFCEKGEVDEAMRLMKEMGLIDLYPDVVTYVLMFKGLCDVQRLEDACGLVKVMKGHGCLPNLVVYTVILEGICRLGSLERALEVLGEMENGDVKPNVVAYTIVIKGFCEKGLSVEALSILDHMKNFKCSPNRITMSTLIEGLCKDGHIEEAYQVIDKVAGDGVSCDECYSSLVVSLWRIGKLEEAENVFRMMISRGLRPDGVASSIILRWLCSEGRFLDAFCLYDGIEKSGNISTIDSDIYSILLSGLCQEKYLGEAKKLASLMVKRGVQLKASYVDNVVKHLKNSSEEKLASYITRIGGCEE